MRRAKNAGLALSIAGAVFFCACGQIDPISLAASFKGENAERFSRLLARVIGIPVGAHRVQFTQSIMVPMRDGLRLATDVYEPLPPGKYPTITCRLPYEKKNLTAIGYIIASHGYVFVIQDTRATGESEGKNFIPVLSDYVDGHDLIAWIKHQPWFNGKIGAWGASFLGRTQWLVSDSPDMTCLYPQFTSMDFAGAHRGGANLHEAVVTWASRTGHHAGRIEGKSRQETERLVRERVMTTGYYNAPLDEPWRVKPAELVGQDLDGILRVLSEKTGENLSWNGPPYSVEVLEKFRDVMFTPGIAEATMGYADPMDRFRNLKSPVLLISGWYDVHNAATMEDFVNIKKYATGAARDGSRLIVGPWAHIMPGRHDAPSGGPHAGQSFAVYRSLFIFDWWDYWLQGRDNAFVHSPPLRIYVMGKNIWRDEYEWPLARTQWTNYYLHSGGKANSLKGDGAFSPEPPGEEPADEYDSDPHQPVPTRGGNKLLPPSGSMDQREVEARNDVLVYTSARLEHELEITGPLRAVIYAASSAVDTDFTAKLVDVYPNGAAINLASGIIRARFRDGREHPALLVPGQVYAFEIDLWCTSNVFLRGHRLRVEISSSNFPEYDRNANRGGTPGEPLVAHQTVYHDASRPSHLILPVIP